MEIDPYLISEWKKYPTEAYKNAKDTRNKIQGRGSAYPFIAKYVVKKCKKYVVENGKKPKRSQLEQWAMKAKSKSKNPNSKRFIGSAKFFTNLINRNNLRKFYETQIKKFNAKKLKNRY